MHMQHSLVTPSAWDREELGLLGLARCLPRHNLLLSLLQNERHVDPVRGRRRRLGWATHCGFAQRSPNGYAGVQCIGAGYVAHLGFIGHRDPFQVRRGHPECVGG